MAWNPKSIEKAVKKAGVRHAFDEDWLTGPDPYGKDFQPVGVVWHHTGCGPLSRGNMPSLGWVRKPGRYAGKARACHVLVGRDGHMQVIAGKGAYHAGAGGPLKVNGTDIPKDLGNRYLIGIEIEASSTTKINRKDQQTPKWGMNPAQFDAVARFCAALFDELGWSTKAAIRHRDWAPKRKIDVGISLEQIWSAIDLHREKKPAKPKPPAPEKPKPPAKPKPKPSVTLANVQPTKKNSDVHIVQQALAKEVGLKVAAANVGKFDAATKTAYAKWQKSLGFTGKDADGVPGVDSLRKLGRKHGFTVKTR